MLKLVLFIAQLVVKSTGDLEFLLFVGLDWSGLLCAHELAVDLVDYRAIALMASLKGRLLFVIGVALAMMLKDLFGDYL